MPDVSAGELLRMHGENKDRFDKQDVRMRKIEDAQVSQLEVLGSLRETLGRIDERTKNLETVKTRLDDHDTKLDDLSKDVNKGKGVGLAVGGGLTLLEGLHIFWDKLFK